MARSSVLVIRPGHVLPDSNEKHDVDRAHNTAVFVPVRHPTPSHELFT